jgi:hypothetical protein
MELHPRSLSTDLPQSQATEQIRRDDAYWRKVREIAASRPELSRERQEELSSIIAASRLRRAREDEEDPVTAHAAQAMCTMRS